MRVAVVTWVDEDGIHVEVYEHEDGATVARNALVCEGRAKFEDTCIHENVDVSDYRPREYPRPRKAGVR